MAKLVDLLAKHLKEWPERAEYARQDYDKEICFHSTIGIGISTEWDFFLNEIAEDADVDGRIGKKKVYMKDWLAARDRLHAETVKEMRETTNADADKALWDKVAVAAIGGVTASDAFHNYANFQGNPDIAAAFAVQVADAFMAERAKRLKGGV